MGAGVRPLPASPRLWFGWSRKSLAGRRHVSSRSRSRLTPGCSCGGNFKRDSPETLAIPRKGFIIPKMGMKRTSRNPRHRSAGLADALFAKVQQRVLGVLFGNPGRSFYANEVIGLARSGTGAVQRELARLEASGLVRVTRLGKQKHYQANPGSPIFNEVRALVLKTVALTDVLRPALAPVSQSIRAAFIYGSIAKGEDTASSDIDLMVVSDRLAYADLFAALEKASTELGRKIAPTNDSDLAT